MAIEAQGYSGVTRYTGLGLGFAGGSLTGIPVTGSDTAPGTGQDGVADIANADLQISVQGERLGEPHN